MSPSFTLVADGRHRSGVVASAEDALRALNNALCCWLPARLTVYTDRQGEPLFRAAVRSLRDGDAVLLAASRRRSGRDAVVEVHAAPAPVHRADPRPVAGLAARTPRSGRWLGIDVGGTDAKAVLWDNGHSRCWTHTFEHAPHERRSVPQWQTLLDPLLASMDSREPLDGIGLAIPELVYDGVVRGHISSKTSALRAAQGGYGPAFERAFDAALATLPVRIGARLGAPVVVVNDGPAAAAASSGPAGTLCLSLGTSVAGALIGPCGAVLPYPLVASGIMAEGGLGSAPHRTTGLPHTLQARACQGGLLALLAPGAKAWRAGWPSAPGERLVAAQREPGLADLWATLGEALAADIATLADQLGDVHQARLYGRLVSGAPAAFWAALHAQCPLPCELAPSLPGIPALTHGQAWGVIRLAAGAPR